MKKVSCAGLIPAEYTVIQGNPLNVLVMAVGAQVFEETATICLHGNVDGKTKLLTSKTFVFPPDEHVHLYLQIPKHCFLPEFWDGHNPEEMTVCTGVNDGSPDQPGKLIFIEPQP